MRRILKKFPSTMEYVRLAVETGIYRTPEELDKVWRERRDSADDLQTVMERFRQDCVRGSNVMDYPPEYLILQQFPPVPDPPHVPAKIRRKIRREANPIHRLVKGNLKRIKENIVQSPEQKLVDYYRKLSGLSPARASGNIPLRSARLERAYDMAVRQYYLQRTSGVSEQEAIQQVDEMLRQEDAAEREQSRARAEMAVQYASSLGDQQQEEVDAEGESFDGEVDEGAEGDLEEGSDEVEETYDDEEEEEEGYEGEEAHDDEEGDEDQEEDKDWSDAANAAGSMLQTIFGDEEVAPRTIEGMMRWSARLKAVPYVEWTVGASTALDHWIARKVLGLSEETWLAMLEGNDPSLLSRGRDVIAVREALFPETQIYTAIADDMSEEKPTDDEDLRIQQLLMSLNILSSDSDTDPTAESQESDGDKKTDRLIEQLQKWRQKNSLQPYESWSVVEKDDFGRWLREDYAKILLIDPEQVDWMATREALLAMPPSSLTDSEAFWNILEDVCYGVEVTAETLAELRQLPEASAFLPDGFWELAPAVQFERLQNLQALRPVLDDYTSKSTRKEFVERHAHTILTGVPLEHLVEDPDGPIRSVDLNFPTPRARRFSIEMRPFRSDDAQSADERVAAIMYLWNQHKSGRAQYEERMFATGRLGLRYGDDMSKHESDDEDEEED